jgi:hypothetical protein
MVPPTGGPPDNQRDPSAALGLLDGLEIKAERLMVAHPGGRRFESG